MTRKILLVLGALALTSALVSTTTPASAAAPCISTAEGNDIWWGRPFGAPALTKTEVNDRANGYAGAPYADWVGAGGGWVWKSYWYNVCAGAHWPGVPNRNYLSLQFRSPDANGPWKLQSPSVGDNLCVGHDYPSWANIPNGAVGFCTDF